MAEIFRMFIKGQETKGIEAEYQDVEDATEKEAIKADYLAEYFFNIHNAMCYQSYVKYGQLKSK
jgi:hypothetical protein